MLAAGTRVGPYEVVSRLGAGGMGEVYRARDTRLHREVALKTLPEELSRQPERLARLKQEARILACLNDPGIATLHGLEETDGGVPVLVMELVEGQTLSERLPLPVGEALAVACQIAHALEAAHQKGILHRDLKPANIRLMPEGRVKLLDFGLAKVLREAVFHSLAATASMPKSEPGAVVGTAAYMSPEQARGEDLDERADVWAFGCVLYEMLTGRRAFPGATWAEMVSALMTREPEYGLVPEAAPAEVVRLLERCLKKDRQRRARDIRDVRLELEEWIAPRGRRAPRTDEEASPYPGLAPFTEAQGEDFFGREAEVEALWVKLRARTLLAVIGPSGGGKTSFVRAGVVASRPDGWAAIVSTPGTSPMLRLGQTLAPELVGDADALKHLVRFEDPEAALGALARWRKRHEAALLVVDQFEELFTLNPPEVQERFAGLLGRLGREADVHVLLSLRDDFLMRCQEHRALSGVFSDLTPLGLPSAAGLRRALVEPAARRGYLFEDEALLDEMLEAVEGERGALPLLGFAIARIWERRDTARHLLTRKAYEEIGGVTGALAQHAEATLGRIGTEKQGLVREVFRNLVTANGTRAVVGREELLSVFPSRESAEEVVDELVRSRLLTAYEVEGGERAAGRHQVEMVHESLLTVWPRLVRWQAQDADGALLRDQLKQAAHLWDEKGRPPDLLWSGTAYDEFRLWRDRYPGSLSALEEDFAGSMREKARKRKRRLRVAAVAAFLALAAVTLAIGVSRNQAVRQRHRAEASKLVALAELRLKEDPTEALAFTIASLEEADNEEARVFAMKALWEAPPAFELAAGSQAVRFPSFSPDGKWLASAGHTADALVWSEDGGRPIVLPGLEPSARCSNSAKWASSDLLVTGSGCMLGTRVHLWSLPNGRHLRTMDFGGPSTWQVGPKLLLSETLESGSEEQPGGGLLRSWTLPEGEPLTLGRVDWRRIGTPPMSFFEPNAGSWVYAKGHNLYSRPLPVGIGPDRVFAPLRAEVAGFWCLTDRLVLFDKSGEIHVWTYGREKSRQEKVIRKPKAATYGILPDASGRWLVGDPYADHEVRLWDLATWNVARPLVLRRNASWYGAMSGFHSRGDWVVASTGAFSRLTFWPLSRSYPAVVDGYASLHRPVVFSPDGKWLATTWEERWVRLWPLRGSEAGEIRSFELPEAPFSVRSLAFDPKGRYLFAVGGKDRAWMLPLDGSAPRTLQGSSPDATLDAVAVSPSGRLVATAFFYGQGDETLRVWDLETGELRRFDLPESPGSETGTRQGRTGYERGIASLGFADESTLYSAGDGGFRRWNLQTGSNELVVPASAGYTTRGPFSANGVAITSERRWARREDDCPHALVINLLSGTSRELTTFGDCDAWGRFGIALDPSGTVAAIGYVDGTVRVGRLSGGEPHLLVGHKGSVDRVAISPDLRWLATTGEDDTLRLWPMPDLSKPPLHTLPHDELLAKLRSLTNLHAVRDTSSASGWKVEVGPFPGWKHAPSW